MFFAEKFFVVFLKDKGIGDCLGTFGIPDQVTKFPVCEFQGKIARVIYFYNIFRFAIAFDKEMGGLIGFWLSKECLHSKPGRISQSEQGEESDDDEEHGKGSLQTIEFQVLIFFNPALTFKVHQSGFDEFIGKVVVGVGIFCRVPRCNFVSVIPVHFDWDIKVSGLRHAADGAIPVEEVVIFIGLKIIFFHFRFYIQMMGDVQIGQPINRIAK